MDLKHQRKLAYFYRIILITVIFLIIINTIYSTKIVRTSEISQLTSSPLSGVVSLRNILNMPAVLINIIILFIPIIISIFAIALLFKRERKTAFFALGLVLYLTANFIAALLGL